MTPDEIAAVRAQLQDGAASLSEVRLVTTFTGFREGPDGGQVRVRVEILDLGEDAGSVRWSIAASDDADNLVHGNSESDLEMAITAFPWDGLGRSDTDV